MRANRLLAKRAILSLFFVGVALAFPSRACAQYDLEVVVRTGDRTPGGNTITNLGRGPSLNEAGKVAFTARIQSGLPAVCLKTGENWERVFPRGSPLVVGDSLQVNTSDQILWFEYTDDGQLYFVSRLDAASGGPTIGRGSKDADEPARFREILPWPTLNNKGRGVFCADLPGGGTVLAARSDGSSDHDVSEVLPGYPTLIAMVADNDYTVVRWGDDPADPILLFTTADFLQAEILADATSFTSLGQKPAISDDGVFVVFPGQHKTRGAGIFGWENYLRFKIAGLSGDGILDPAEIWMDGNTNGKVDVGEDLGPFSAFHSGSRLGVNLSGNGNPKSYTVAFLAATNGPGTVGLYTIEVDVTDTASPNVSMPRLVAQVGDFPSVDRFPGRITEIVLHDPINSNGQLAFWVNTDAGQAVIKASPQPAACEDCGEVGARAEAYMCSLSSLRVKNDSLNATFGLGRTTAGGGASLKLRAKTPSPLLSSPQALALAGSLGDLTPLYRNNRLRQVKGAQGLADIVVSNSYAYELRFYGDAGAKNASTGLYEPPGLPFSSIRVENPDGATAFNRLCITRNGSDISLFTYAPASNAWELVTGFANALRRETTQETRAGSLRTVSRTVRDAGTNLVSQSVSFYRTFPWGEELVQTTEGLAPTTKSISYTFYTNLTDGFNYRRLRSVRHSNGYWEYYKSYGAQGLTKSVRQFGNNPYAETASWPDGSNRSSEVTYSGKMETHLEYLKGRLVSKRWRNEVVPGETWDCVATHPTITNWDSPSNLITRTFEYRNTDSQGAWVGHVHKAINPDGTMTLYRYFTETITDPFSAELPPPQLRVRRTVTSSGQGNTDNTEVIDGERTETIEDLYGNAISRREYDILSGLLINSEITTTRDTFGRLTRIDYLDDTYVNRSYDCCGLAQETDREGITTTYNTDHTVLLDLDHNGTPETYYGTTVTRAGISTHTFTDTLGRAFKTIIQGTNGALIVEDERHYNVLGDLDWTKDALSRTTTYSETNQGGFTLRTTTFPDGSQSIGSTYQDGSACETRGNAVQSLRYAYDAVQDNGVWVQTTTQTRLETNGAPSAEFTSTYTDFAGRAYKTQSPWPDGGTSAVAFRAYNARGQLAKSTDADGVSTLYTYNGHGELETTAVDVANPGVIDFGGADRITRSTTAWENSALRGSVVHRTVTEVWENNGSPQSTIVQTSETSADGTQNWLTQCGLTTRTTTAIDRANRRRTVISVNPDGTSTEAVFEQGLQKSVTRYDANTSQVTQTAFEYDAFGRLQTSTDARNGATTYTYYDDGQLHTVTTPDPDPGASGPGLDPQTTSYTYFGDRGNGTKTVITLPDGGIVTQEFHPGGQLKKTWGARTYPAAYTYDRAGRVETLTTWQQFDFASGNGLGGAATTRWNYSAQATLSNKRYADNKGPGYTYTAGGKLKTRLWARGVLTSYHYDDKTGDLLAITYSDSTPAVTNTYDRLGRLASVTDASGLRTFGYSHGQTATETYAAGMFTGTTLQRGYDSLQRIESLTVTSPDQPLYHVTYGYDPASRLQTVTAGPDVATYAYHPGSDLVHTIVQRHSNAVRLTTTKRYDRLNRLQSITCVPSADRPISFAYQYNDANHRVRAALATGEFWSYGYDFLGQVTNGVKQLPAGAPIPGYSFGYQFDAVGNRTAATRQNQTDDYTPNLLNQIESINYAPWLHLLGVVNSNATITVNGQSPVRSDNYFYAQIASTSVWNAVSTQARAAGQAANGTDALAEEVGHLSVPFGTASLQYDDDGNLLSDGRWSYVWDGENRVLKKETLPAMPQAARRKLEYTLDAQGRRVRVKVSEGSSGAWRLTSGRKYIANDFELLAELDGAADTVTRAFVWGLDVSQTRGEGAGVGGLLALREASTQLAISDGNGNVTALVNSNDGLESGTYEYDPFGSLLRVTGATAKLNPFCFSTKFREDDTQSSCYEYRDYSPGRGRYDSRDPLEELEANVYHFVQNDPVDFYDLFGLTKIGEVLECFFSTSAEPMRWVMDQTDEYTVRVRAWGEVRDAVEEIKRDLMRNCSHWKTHHQTTPSWQPPSNVQMPPTESTVRDPHAFRKKVPSPRGTDVKTAGTAYIQYVRSGRQEDALWTSAIGSFDLNVTVDCIDCEHGKAVIRVWMYDPMTEESFGTQNRYFPKPGPLALRENRNKWAIELARQKARKEGVWFAEQCPGFLYRWVLRRFPWSGSGKAPQYMWWNWTESHEWTVR